jgi:serine/threonine protein kinase
MKYRINSEPFELDSKYKVLEYLGAGAYGVVASCHNSQDNTTYAIKKCKKVFYSRTLAKRTLREMRLLRLIDNDNIVKIRSILIPSNLLSFDSMYVVFEIMEVSQEQEEEEK